MKNIFNWIISLFKKDEKTVKLPNNKIEEKVNIDDNNFFDQLRVKDNIFDIKSKFERGIIDMADMTIEQIIQLTNIYNEDTAIKRKKINILKEKIAKILGENDTCYNN